VRPRKAKLAARAQRELAAAVERASSVGAPQDPDLRRTFRDALGQARLAQADRDLETYLAVQMPKHLDFRVDEWKRDADDPKLRKHYEAQKANKDRAIKAFQRYLDTKFRTGKKLEATYVSIRETSSNPALVRAALRSAWVSQNLADQLVSTPMPKSLETPEQRAAYCGAIVDQTKTPRSIAREAARFCVDKATQSKVSIPAVDRCRALLDETEAQANPPPQQAESG
jgi:hypothetical protein